MRARMLVVGLALVVLSAPVLPSLARAQQPAPPAAGPDLFAESMTSIGPTHRSDSYDVAADAVNVLRPPLKAGLCAIGVAAGLAVFGVTLGTAYRAAVEAVHEGCGGKWLLTGDDIRPSQMHDGWADEAG